MNVLFLSQIVPYPPHGGVLQRGYNLIREMAKRNDVTLLAFVHPDVLHTPESVDDSRVQLGRYCSRIEYFPLWPKESKRLRGLGHAWAAVSRYPFSVLAHRSLAFAASIRQALIRSKVDVVHFDTLGLAQYRALAGSSRCVLTHHNVESMLMARRAAREEGRLARLYLAHQARRLRSYEASVCPQFDLNITVSDSDAETLGAIVPGVRTTTIANGVDIAYFRPRATEAEGNIPSLIYTGGMNMFANRDAVGHFLRNIWPRIKQVVPEVKFYAVGQDPSPEVLTAARSDQRVIVTGFVEDIRPLVAEASVYVVPLRVGGGTRLKVLDAMALGKAIVSTRVGAEGICATDRQNILLADGEQSFADAVVHLLRTPRERARLGAEARKLAEREYSWEKIGARLQATYEAVVLRGGRS